MAQDPPDMESVHSHFTLVTVALTQEEAASTEKAICTKKEKEGPNDLGKATPAASGRKSLTSATGRTVAVWLHVSRVLFFGAKDWQTQRLLSGCKQTWRRVQYENGLQLGDVVFWMKQSAANVLEDGFLSGKYFVC